MARKRKGERRPSAAELASSRRTVDLDPVVVRPPDDRWGPNPGTKPTLGDGSGTAPPWTQQPGPPGGGGGGGNAPLPPISPPVVRDKNVRLVGDRAFNIKVGIKDQTNQAVFRQPIPVPQGQWLAQLTLQFESGGRITNGEGTLAFTGNDGSGLTWTISGPPAIATGGYRWQIGGGFFVRIEGKYDTGRKGFDGMFYFGYDNDGN